MKTRFNPFLALALAFATQIPLPAAVLTWDITPGDSAVTGGSGDWDTSTANWTTDAGVTNVAWPSTSTGDDDAVFGNLGGTVTLDAGGITANDITFSLAGYTIGGGDLTLDSLDPDGVGPLTGPLPILNAGPASQNQPATINSNIISSLGIEKSGGSTLTLGGDLSDISGTILINGGVVTSPANNNSGITFGATATPPTAATIDIRDNNFLSLNGQTLGEDVDVILRGGGGYSAPQGALRGVSGASVIEGGVSIANNAVRLGNLGTSTTFAGPVTAASGSGFGMLIRVASNQGVIFTNTSNYWEGSTLLGDGSYYFQPGTLPAASNLSMAGSGNTWFETSGTFTRPIGTGAGQVQFNSTAGRINGISARGGALSVNIGGSVTPDTLVWGSGGFVPGAFGLNGANATHDISLANPLDLNGAARIINVAAQSATFPGGISNSSATAASLRKTGAGSLSYDPGSAYTLTLAGLNMGGGTVELKSGTYTINGSAPTGQPDSTNGFMVARGGTFRLSGATVNCTGGSYVFPSGNTGGNNNSFILDSGTLDAGGREALNAYGSTGTTTINGGLFVCGQFRVAQSTGVLNLNGGTLRTTNLSHGGGTSTVNFNGGTLQAKANTTNYISTSVSNAVVQFGGAVIDSAGFNITIPKILTEDPLSVGGGLSKRGNGILDLTADNTYTGANLILGGVLRVGANSNLGDAAAEVTVSGGEFGVSGTDITSISSLGRTFTYISGGFHVADASHVLDVDVDLTGGATLSKSGPGTITLSGTNDFTGGLSMGSGNNGWIEVDEDSDLGTGPKTVNMASSAGGSIGGIRLLGGVTVTDVALNLAGRNVDAATQHALLNVSGNNVWDGDINISNSGGTYYLRSEDGQLELAGTLSNAQPANPTPDTRAFNFEGPGDYLVSGTIADGANANRFTGLAMKGTGTATLTGSQTYTGSTAVVSGTLALVNASMASPITVESDATLGFTAGSPTTSTSTVTFAGATPKVKVTGTPVAGTLMTATSITGTPVLDPAIPGFELAIAGGGTLLNLVSTSSSPFDTWATTTNGLAGGDAAAGADPDSDGLSNLVEFVLGGQPNPANPNASSVALAPTQEIVGSNLVFTYRRTDLSSTEAGLAVSVEFGTNLSGWTTAVDGVGGVTVTETPDGFGAGIDKIEVSIPMGTETELFARLKASL